MTTDSNTENRTHNAQDEITVAGGNNLTYDANGNLTTDETGKTFIYDAWNRLVEVKNGANTLVRYNVDALNRKISETKAGVTTDLYYSASWQVIEERVGGVAKTQYVWSPVYVDALICRDRDTDGNGSLDERLYAIQDANWNVTALVDVNGNVVERFGYDPFGKATIYDANWNVRANSLYDWKHLHQGLSFESLTGLYYNRFRWYSPTLGRFLQRDPIGFAAGDRNVYRYVSNNPIIFIDLLGLGKSLGISFVSDWKEGTASSYAYWNTDIHVKIDTTANINWQNVQNEIAAALGNECIEFVLFTGHGGPASVGSGTITMADLTTPTSDVYKFLNWLRTQSCANDHKGTRINACMVAKGQAGKDFIAEMAKVLDSEVKAWDDWYAIVPHGKEFTGYPDGTWKETGDTKRVYAGSWIEWVNGGGKTKKPNVGDGKPDETAGKKGKGGKESGVKVNRKGKRGLKDDLK